MKGQVKSARQYHCERKGPRREGAASLSAQLFFRGGVSRAHRKPSQPAALLIKNYRPSNSRPVSFSCAEASRTIHQRYPHFFLSRGVISLSSPVPLCLPRAQRARFPVFVLFSLGLRSFLRSPITIPCVYYHGRSIFSVPDVFLMLRFRFGFTGSVILFVIVYYYLLCLVSRLSSCSCCVLVSLFRFY